MSSWTPTRGALVADRYLLLEELARGGMGAVWRAEHTGLQIECAVKFVATHRLNDELRTRFRREARAAARLKSRFVVNMLDYGLWEEQPYIAMELLEGESLGDRLDREGGLGVGETAHIVSGVARALASAWALGIVHRDLKPGNIFLVTEDGETYPKVLDFGIAKVNEPAKLDAQFNTDTGALLGTPWYMSPEQLDGTMTLDVRSDLFALSVITYECLTGELPFDSDAMGNLMTQIMHGDRPLPSDVTPVLPPAFDDWWLRAAAIDPEERYSTPQAWVDALRESLELSPQSSGTWDVIPASMASAPRTTRDEEQERPPADATTRPMETFSGQARGSGKHSRGSRGATWLVLAVLAVVGAGLWWATMGPGAGTPAPAGSDAQAETNEPPSVEATVAETSDAVAGSAAPSTSATVTPTASASASTSATPAPRPVAWPRPRVAKPSPKPAPAPEPKPTGIAPDAPGF